MADVRCRVLVRRSATDAVFRVGRMLQRRVGAAWIVDAERHCTRTLACEIAHLRIVAVHAERQAGCEPVDRTRVELPEELPRHCRAAAGADEPREPPSDPRGGDLGGERNRQTHVRAGYPSAFLPRTGEPIECCPKGGCHGRNPPLASVYARRVAAVFGLIPSWLRPRVGGRKKERRNTR